MNPWYQSDWFAYIIIAGVFAGGMIPLIAGILHYVRDNRRLDREWESRNVKKLLK